MVRCIVLTLTWIMLVLLNSACGGNGEGAPEPEPEQEAPGTYPPHQPIRTEYPAITRDGIWRMQGGDQFQSHHVAASLGAAPQELWRYVCEGGLDVPGLTGDDDSLTYLSNNLLLSVSADGAVQRLAQFGRPAYRALLALPNGLWCTYTADGDLVAINDAGQEQYSLTQYWEIEPPLVQDSAGNIYGFIEGPGAACISAEGELLWHIALYDYGLTNRLAVTPDGLLILLTTGTAILGIRDGTMFWERDLAENTGRIITTADNRILLTRYIPGAEPPDEFRYLQEINPANGIAFQQWDLADVGENAQGPLLAPDGTIYQAGSTAIAAQAADGTLLWRNADYSGDYYNLVLGADAYLYALQYLPVEGETYRRSILRCFSAQGQQRWEKAVDPQAVPVFGGVPGLYAVPSGGVYVCESHALRRYSADGSLLWRRLNNMSVYQPAVFDASGNAYLGLNQSTISFDPAGTIRWQTDCENSAWQVALSPNDSTLYSIGGSRVSALDTAGSLLWQQEHETDALLSAPVISADGTLLFGPNWWYDGLTALRADGTLYWRYIDDQEVLTGPAVDDAGSIYIGTRGTPLPSGGFDGGWIKCLQRNGEQLWAVGLNAGPASAPLLREDGSILIADGLGRLYAFTSSGEAMWTYDTGVSGDYSLALSGDGTLYLALESDYSSTLFDGNSALYVISQTGELLSSTESTDPLGWFSGYCDGAGQYLAYERDNTYPTQYVRAVAPGNADLWLLHNPDHFDGLFFNGLHALSPSGQLFISANGLLAVYGGG